jgi:flagellar biosynthesis/type III secretory pathway protein FliH
MKGNEFRIRMNFPLRNVTIHRGDDAWPPVPQSPATPNMELPSFPFTQTQPAVQPPANLWESEIGQFLQEDRRIIESLGTALTKATVDIQHKKESQLGELQQAAIELAVTIAAQLLHQTIEKDQFPIEPMVREMVQNLREQISEDQTITVRLNPQDMELLESRLEGKPLIEEMENRIRVNPDESISRGNCRLEARDNLLFSDLVNQINQIREDLLRRLGNAGA